jgi:siroheme synthase (precorrin-2 oxidase/ferrochelatase)
VLEAVYNNDIERLKAMAITSEEYESYIWPQSPLSKIKQWQENYDFVWKQQFSRSSHSLRQMLARYGGRQYTLIRVRFEDDTTDHAIYKAHRDARLLVENPEGKEMELNLFGSIVEMDSQFKIMSFDTH